MTKRFFAPLAAIVALTLSWIPATAVAAPDVGPTVLPDLIATSVIAPASVGAGKTFGVMVHIVNQGGGAAAATNGSVLLGNTSRLKESGHGLTSFPIPALGSGQATTITVNAVTALNESGFEFVGVMLDPNGNVLESDESNNVDPFPTTLHGNAPITIERWEVVNTTDVAIPDLTTVRSTITVSGLDFPWSPVPLKVFVQIFHTDRGDLKLELVDPSGGAHLLEDFPGSDNTHNVIKTYVVSGTEFVTVNGTWQLRVTDKAPVDTGSLDKWSISAQ